MNSSTHLGAYDSPGSDVPGGEELQINPAAWPAPETITPQPGNLPPAPNPDPARNQPANAVSSSAEELRDNWERVKDNFKRRYAELTDDDLAYIPGQAQALIDRIHQKTGLGQGEIIDALNLPAKNKA